jgi:hypothetical protein
MKPKLIIIGDSFCANRTSPNSWITYLQNYLYNYDICGEGRPGTGWWTHNRCYNATINSLTEQLAENDILIWAHSSAYRLPNDYDVPITTSVTYFDINDPRYDEIDKEKPQHLKMFNVAKEFYQSDLFSMNYYEWAELAFWKELQLKTAQYKKVIHLFGFADTNFKYNRNVLMSDNSILVTPTLRDLSAADEPNFVGGKDDRINHFNAHNNQELAKFIIKLINDSPVQQEVAIDYSTWNLKDKSKLDGL